MRKLLFILLIFSFGQGFAQNTTAKLKQFYEHNVTEKVYLQLNNVLYQPDEVVHYKLYVTQANHSPSTMSEYVYVSIFDGSNKKIETQTYWVENGSALGSFSIKKEMAAGIYKIKAYTLWQNKMKDVGFETSFWVQKVVSPRILMSLDFKKKGYGKGENCEADFELKTLENIPLRNYRFKYELFLEGKKTNEFTAQTNQEGKAVLQFQLPQNLETTDGLVNVLVDYDQYQESITRAVPINLKNVDLQFLPESGHFVYNESCRLFFIAKNEFGLPLDVSGIIIDQNGQTVTTFESQHDGMGFFELKAAENQRYSAQITSPFHTTLPVVLSAASAEAYMINSVDAAKGQFKIFAPKTVSADILVRNTDKIHQKTTLQLEKGWNAWSLEPNLFPVGIQNLSLLINDVIVAEKLVFLNAQNGLHISIKTDKETYLPRQKVKATLTTLDGDNKPIASNLSVAVVDQKLLSYLNNKQHNILSWLFLGHELKGTIREPSYYFDEKNSFEKRALAIDLLLNTHGWRKYNQEDLFDVNYPQTKLMPEKSNDIEGYVLDKKNKPIKTKISLFTDKEKVYETQTNADGYFKFTKTFYENFAYLVIENKKHKDLKINNSVTEYEQFSLRTDSLSKQILKPINLNIKTNTTGFKTKTPVNQGGTIVMKESNQNLNEVVVVGYGSMYKKDLTGSVVRLTSVNLLLETQAALNGQVAGVVVQSASGQPGNGGNVIIRGISSIYGSRGLSQPMVIIDGIPFVNNENANIFGSLSPADISSIDILKDAAASALYGTNANHGVILITTKKGSFNGTNGIVLGKQINYKISFINKSNVKKLTVPEQFYVPVYETIATDEKTDFRSCLYWNGLIHTNKEGKAQFEFYNSDETTSFKIIAEGLSYKGDVGKAETIYSVNEAIQSDLKIPLYTTVGDHIRLPLHLKNTTNTVMNLSASLKLPSQLSSSTTTVALTLAPHESQLFYFDIEAQKAGLQLPLSILINGVDYKNTIKHQMDIYAKGYPMNIDIAGTQTTNQSFTISDVIPETLQSGFKIYYNPFTAITDGLQSMLREPSGCFEQVSSSNYPNVMALQLLSQSKTINEEQKNKALDYLKKGYQKMKNYESKDGGFEWFGANPGHEALTAYGLLQFNEMKDFIPIDNDLTQRSIKWLYSHKDQNGGFVLNKGKYDGFSNIPYAVNNAYITYVLSELNQKDNEKEIETAYTEALKSQDAYRLVLCALTAYNTGNTDRYHELNAILRKKISQFGFNALPVERSIVKSYGKSLGVEMAALYALSLLKEKKITQEVDAVLQFVQASKTAYGFGSTQATALALKAITNYTLIAKASKMDSEIALQLNGKTIDCSQKDANGNLNLTNLEGVKTGKNVFDVQMIAKQPLPFLFYLSYQTFLPPNSDACLVGLNTQLANSKIKLSQTTRLKIEIQNKSNQSIDNPIVRIGLPGGTSIEPWQLKELVEKEKVAYFEIFGSELVLYFRYLAPNQISPIDLDLKAIIPGKYTAVASSAYLYYNNQHKNWNKGLEIEIED